MSILRPAPVEQAARNRVEPIPSRCNACHRTGGQLTKETRDGQELWLCVNFRECVAASESVS